MFSITSMVICDGDGKRIAAKYYDDRFPNVKEQLAFEKKLVSKSSKGKVDVIPLNNLITLYKGFEDAHFFVTGGNDENELVLYGVMNALVLSVSQLTLEERPSKRGIFEKLGAVLMVFDEISDGGIILEIDPVNIVRRVHEKGITSEYRITDLKLNEQTVSGVLSSGRKYFQDKIQRLREIDV